MRLVALALWLLLEAEEPREFVATLELRLADEDWFDPRLAVAVLRLVDALRLPVVAAEREFMFELRVFRFELRVACPERVLVAPLRE